jgi:hypothetical protein
MEKDPRVKPEGDDGGVGDPWLWRLAGFLLSREWHLILLSFQRMRETSFEGCKKAKWKRTLGSSPRVTVLGW